jgi:hypothetical protein
LRPLGAASIVNPFSLSLCIMPCLSSNPN